MRPYVKLRCPLIEPGYTTLQTSPPIQNPNHARAAKSPLTVDTVASRYGHYSSRLQVRKVATYQMDYLVTR